jgi:aminoglycoside phosphotransferase (APT) family kinase protein
LTEGWDQLGRTKLQFAGAVGVCRSSNKLGDTYVLMVWVRSNAVAHRHSQLDDNEEQGEVKRPIWMALKKRQGVKFLGV